MMETDYMMTRLKESVKLIPAGARSGYEGNTEEENNGYVVFKWNIHSSTGKQDGGERGGVTPPVPTPPTNIERRRERFSLDVGYFFMPVVDRAE